MVAVAQEGLHLRVVLVACQDHRHVQLFPGGRFAIELAVRILPHVPLQRPRHVTIVGDLYHLVADGALRDLGDFGHRRFDVGTAVRINQHLGGIVIVDIGCHPGKADRKERQDDQHRAQSHQQRVPGAQTPYNHDSQHHQQESDQQRCQPVARLLQVEHRQTLEWLEFDQHVQTEQGHWQQQG